MVTSYSYTEDGLGNNIPDSTVLYGVGGILVQPIWEGVDFTGLFQNAQMLGHQYLSFANCNTQSTNPGLKTVTYPM